MMLILAVNVGSTSYKYKLFNMKSDEVIASGQVERIGTIDSKIKHYQAGQDAVIKKINVQNHETAIVEMINLLTDHENGCIGSLSEIDGIGFKTVHAGEMTGTLLVNGEVIKAMEKYVDAAPSHNPAYINSINYFSDKYPDTPLVAVFETGFHQYIPDYAYIYSVPYEWYTKYGIRKYGFHGASLKYIANRTAEIMKKGIEGLKIIACHLGGSSSICAIEGGISVDTSMGFTPQAGVPMNNRCGDIDPFIIPYIMDKENLSTTDLRTLLTKESGLLGISGISGDVRDIEDAAAKGNERAELALASYSYQVKKFIGAYSAVMNGFDVLVFSGGIGENAPGVRRRICSGLDFLGLSLDEEQNVNYIGGERTISKKGSKKPIMVIPTDEEKIVAYETFRMITTQVV